MISHNSNSVNSGIIFNYDQNNIRSYIGPPSQNLLTEITQRGISDNGTNYRVFSGVEDVYIPSIGYIYSCKYVDSYNDYNGGSGNCCPSLFGYGNGISISGNTTYTYGIVYRSVNGYSHPNFMYHYEFNSSGSYLTEFGVHLVGGYSGIETHLGNGWYWSRAKFTSQSTAASINSGLWMYQYATWNRLYIAKAVLLSGDYTGLHPKYWPAINSTRSNTQALLDLTGNNTITVNNLTYNSDGTFVWSSGVNSSITSTVSALAFGISDFTIECWIKPTNFSGYTHMVAIPDQTVFALKGNSGTGEIYFYSPGFTTYGTITNWTMTANTWNHVVFIRRGSVAYGFLNGVLSGSKSGFTNNFTSTSLSIGNGYLNEYTSKQISKVSIYNRALSSSEVLQNFNAQRSRYGL